MKSILHLLAATFWVASPWLVTAETPALLTTFNNPTPQTGDHFSWSVAALGNDRVLIGAPYDGPTNAGSVHLFGTNGTLLTTFTNPSPAYTIRFGNPEWDGDLFGLAIAGLSNDRVLIGAPYDGWFWDGKVYVFRTNGVLLTTINTPSMYAGGDRFGASVAVLDNERLIVSAPGHTADPDFGNGVGVVYLLNTNGTLLATFNNPIEWQQYAEFGFSVAAFGTDRVLVGARDAGAAYLFQANGTLLMTFTNPAPTASDQFGHSVAAVGSDRVFVGAPQADQDATDAGVAYLFSTNGTLLTTFTNPTPAAGDAFGARVAVLGNDRIIITSIYDDSGATNSGVAHLFSTSGTLLNTITNPTPATSDAFGARVAAIGDDRVIIGATYEDLGATDAGVAYLFGIPAPAAPLLLTIRKTSSNTVAIAWPSPSTGFVLQQNTNGLGSVNWSNVTAAVQTVGTNETLIVNPIGGSRFYRLVKP